jgi:hypothetical protein
VGDQLVVDEAPRALLDLAVLVRHRIRAHAATR